MNESVLLTTIIASSDKGLLYLDTYLEQRLKALETWDFTG